MWLGLLLLLLAQESATPLEHVDSFVKLTEDLRTHFRLSCVTLVHSRPDAEWALRLLEPLGRRGLPLVVRAFDAGTPSDGTPSSTPAPGSAAASLPAHLLYGDLAPAATHAENRCLRVAGGPRVGRAFAQAASAVPDCSAPWLVLLPPAVAEDQAEEEDESLRGSLLPFDCVVITARALPPGDSYLLLEVYRERAKGPMMVDWRALWKPSYSTAPAPRGNLVHRRPGLGGTELVVAYVEDPPYVLPVKKRPISSSEDIGGISAEIFWELSELMKFRARLVAPADGAWGALLPNGSWSGVVGLLQRRDADATLNALVMSPARSRALSYSTPVINTPAVVLVRRGGRADGGLGAFLAPFSGAVWLSCGALLLLLALALWGTESLARRALSAPAPLHAPRDALFCAWGAFFAQGMAETPRAAGSRLAFWLAYIAGVTLTAAYCANLMSHLTVRTHSPPFRSLAAMLDVRPHVAFSVPRASGVLTFFQARPGTTMDRVYQQHLKGRWLPPTVQRGLQSLCSSQPRAFMASRLPTMQPREKVPCALMEIPSASIPQFLGLAFQRSSGYKLLADHYLLRLRQAGVLQRAEFRYAPRRLATPPEPFEQVALAMVAPVLGCWAAGVALAAAFLVGERLRPPASPSSAHAVVAAASPGTTSAERRDICEAGPTSATPRRPVVVSGGWSGLGSGGHPLSKSGLGVALGLKGAAGLQEAQGHRKAYDAALPAPTRLLWAD